MSEEVLSCGCGIPLFTEEQMAEAKVAGEKEANKLLAEELSDQSVRLTDFVKESWGNDLTYEAFKVSFEVFNLILTDFQYVKLWANYRQLILPTPKGGGFSNYTPTTTGMLAFDGSIRAKITSAAAVSLCVV
jgi:hypothetical protein